MAVDRSQVFSCADVALSRTSVRPWPGCSEAVLPRAVSRTRSGTEETRTARFRHASLWRRGAGGPALAARLPSAMAGSTDVTLRTAYVTAAFCSLVAVLYAAIAVEPAPILLLFISFAPLTAVCLWLQKDARHAGIGGVQDWGFFLWLF